MARRFAKVSEEEIEETFFYPSDLVNTKTTIPLRVGEERCIYTSTLRAFVCIHHYSPPLRRIVVYYTGLEITAGQRTMSGMIVDLTGQTFVLPVMLTGQNSIVLKMK